MKRLTRGWGMGPVYERYCGVLTRKTWYAKQLVFNVLMPFITEIHNGLVDHFLISDSNVGVMYVTSIKVLYL
jgi:hypothetical protein